MNNGRQSDRRLDGKKDGKYCYRRWPNADSPSCLELWDGKLSINSKPAEGTTVLVFLPVVNPAPKLRAVNTNRSRKRTYYDAVLIDDEALVQNSLRIRAQILKKKIRCFSSFQEFELSLGEIDLRSPVFVDYDLGKNEVKGDQRAIEIRELGFKEVYLCTGNVEAPEFSKATGIKILDKKLPWEIDDSGNVRQFLERPVNKSGRSQSQIAKRENRRL